MHEESIEFELAPYLKTAFKAVGVAKEFALSLGLAINDSVISIFLWRP